MGKNQRWKIDEKNARLLMMEKKDLENGVGDRLVFYATLASDAGSALRRHLCNEVIKSIDRGAFHNPDSCRDSL